MEVTPTITQAYLPLLVQQTEEGKRVEGVGNPFLGNLSAFEAAAEQEKQHLPAKIRADLAEADKIAKAAVAEQKPLFFTGGVPQHMTFANDRLALFKVLDPKNAAVLEKEVRAIETSLQKNEQSLSQLIIEQNPLPADRYTGPDRAKLTVQWRRKITTQQLHVARQNQVRMEPWSPKDRAPSQLLVSSFSAILPGMVNPWWCLCR